VLQHLSVRAQALLDVPMATVLVAVYDPEPRQPTFALAGHLAPLIAPLDAPPGFVEVRLPPEAVCDHVLRELDRVQGGDDDIALLVITHAA
jgi:hypothetical protein